MIETTDDRFLDGRVTVRQPKRGFRAGLDAVMVAAAVPAQDGDTVLELGAGCGTASLCLAARVTGCAVTCVEIDKDLVALAHQNARTNGMEARLTLLEMDALGQHLRGQFDHVFANPPFHHTSGQASRDEQRERAKRDERGIGTWVRAGLGRVRSGGSLTMIVRGDRLRDVLIDAPETGVLVFPLWPRTGESAKRVIVQVRKGSSAPLEILPGLVLHDLSGKYMTEADGVLRGGEALAIGVAR